MRGSVVALALGACAAERSVELPAELAAGSVIIAQRADEGLLLTAQRAPLDTLSVEVGATLMFFRYELPLELLGATSGEPGRVELVDLETPEGERWPLPVPTASWTLASGALVLEPGASLDPTTLFVKRPACPPAGEATVVRIDPRDRSVVDAVKIPGGVLATVEPAMEDDRVVEPSAAFLLSDGATEWRPRGAGSGNAQSWGDIIAFEDEGAWLIWPQRHSDVWDLVSATRSDVPAINFEAPEEIRPFKILRAASARVRGAWTIVARGHRYREVSDGNERISTHLVALDPATGTMRDLFGPIIADACKLGIETSPLTLTADGTGLFGYEGGPIARFDLGASAPGPRYIDEPVMCRSARLTLASGTEIVAYDTPTSPPSSLAWRPPGGDWRRVESTASGAAAVALGDRFLATTVENTVGLFEHEPRRPEVAPRLCHAIPTNGVRAHRLVKLDDHRIFAGGHGNQAAIIVLP